MEIKLNSLILENFKGISYFELNVDGKNASVYGTNASGKTTLADAYFGYCSEKTVMVLQISILKQSEQQDLIIALLVLLK